MQWTLSFLPGLGAGKIGWLRVRFTGGLSVSRLKSLALAV